MRKNHATMDAMLRHLAAGEDVDAFPGTKFENLALVRAATRRGLIAWDEEQNRYGLTPAGWSELTPRRFGLPSLMVSTAVGAAVGAAALAMLWVPGLRWPTPAQGHATPLAAVVEKPVAAPASVPAERGGRSVAPMQASTAQPAPAARAADSGSSAAPAPALEPAQVVEQPAAEQPSAEPAPAPVKHATKKSPRKTVRRNDPANGGWPFSGGWRTRQSADSRFGQGSFFNYR
jgi:hypothetical protein